MKIAYFDCPSGIAGNMILGALLDAGLEKDYLKKELLKILNPKSQIPNKFKIQITKTKKHGISGTLVEVKTKGKEKPHSLFDILTIIKMSKLSKTVKTLSSQIFKRLTEAKAKVQAEPIGQVRLHDIGAIDAMVDIVGTAIGLEKLGVDKVYCSPLPHGKGRIKHKHGYLPNPAPATAELLKGIPTYGINIKGELVTPTGAAIISTLAKEFGDMPRLKVEHIGYGAGTLDLPIPNLLRVFIGEAELPTEKDAVLQIETNIDDMDPKLYDQAIARIMKAGALDASIYPIRMKKKRNAVKLEVLCKPEDKDKILDAIFTETTTIGTRVYLVKREKLRREIKAGKKISYLGKEVKMIKRESP